MANTPTAPATPKRAKRKPFAFVPFDQLVARVERDRVCRWSDIEDDFLARMTEWDLELVSGRVKAGGGYNIKGKVFERLIETLIASTSGEDVFDGDYEGCAFPIHQLDTAYPAPGAGPLRAVIESKMLGASPHAGNEQSANEGGRATARDIDKRLREVGFTCVDLKRRWGPDPDLSLAKPTLLQTPPLYMLALAVRPADDHDREELMRKVRGLADWYVDGVGVFIYEAPDANEPTAYQKRDPGEGFQIDEVIRRFSERVAGR